MRSLFIIATLCFGAHAIPIHTTLRSEVALTSTGSKAPIRATAKFTNGGWEYAGLKCRVTTRWYVAPKAHRAAGSWHSQKTTTMKETFKLKPRETREIKLADLSLPEEIARLNKRGYFPFGAEVTVALYNPQVPVIDVFRTTRQIAIDP